MFHRFIAFLCLMGLFFCQKFAPAQPMPERRPFKGQVLDAEGQPVKGALVMLRRQEDVGTFAFWGAVVATDARGAFLFPSAEEGSYYLNVEAPGFAQLQNKTVQWAESTKPPVFTLERMAAVVFRVLDTEGEPLANAPVFARLRGDGEAGQNYRRASTNAEGKVTFSDLVPAKYSIHVVAPGHGYAISNDLPLRYTPSPRARDLRLQEGGRLSVRVRETSSEDAAQEQPDGKLLGGAMLTLTPANSAEATRLMGEVADAGENVVLLVAQNDRLAICSRDGDGSLQLSDIAPGKYQMRMYLSGYVPAEARPVEIKAGQTVSLNWNFTARSASMLTLSLTDSSGNPVPGGREFVVRLLPIGQGGGLRAGEDDDMPGMPFFAGGNSGRRALTDEQGRLTLYPVKSRRYRILVGARPAQPGKAPDFASLDMEVPLPEAKATIKLPLSAFTP